MNFFDKIKNTTLVKATKAGFEAAEAVISEDETVKKVRTSIQDASASLARKALNKLEGIANKGSDKAVEAHREPQTVDCEFREVN